jgi:hypothetical protein
MIRYKGRATVYGELWYDEAVPNEPEVDIVVHRQRTAPLSGATTTPTLTLAIDLRTEQSAIMAAFGKDCRYKIRRADTKDGLSLAFVREPAHRLEEFCGFYDEFADQKGIGHADRQWLRAACDAGRLVLAACVRNGEALVWHAYLVSGHTARLQYTGSCFRGRSTDYRSMVGRANRWLHWHVMLRFKDLGLVCYDWGGLFEDESAPERAGINRFKKEFGGETRRRYDCVVPVTVKGRLWVPIRSWCSALGELQSAFVGLARGSG